MFNTKLHYAGILALQSGPALVFNTKLPYAGILELQNKTLTVQWQTLQLLLVGQHG